MIQIQLREMDSEPGISKVPRHHPWGGGERSARTPATSKWKAADQGRGAERLRTCRWPPVTSNHSQMPEILLGTSAETRGNLLPEGHGTTEGARDCKPNLPGERQSRMARRKLSFFPDTTRESRGERTSQPQPSPCRDSSAEGEARRRTLAAGRAALNLTSGSLGGA
ncbi:hypothetical protein AAFF_G00251780 [Aldrovandia affinis]|uniref:Uncharacterized protein n=1 Tax=Aldrovandia affinis TaxID=143900 RepID=A0AAD7SUP3_9TELE|nr:hypothetical protein AAFF_G00251780 [Aldrovandia affinis]